MVDLTLKEVINLCREALMKCWIKEDEDGYQESQDFFKENGFHYEETWSLDNTLACFILPRLIHYRNINSGIPCTLLKYDVNGRAINEKEAEKEWYSILNKMIEAFYLIVIDMVDLSFFVENREEKINEGLILFAEYYRSLWD